MIFDLDGTLVQTERLKALSYVRAAVELCPHKITESEVVEAFKEVVGLSRREVAIALMGRFELEENARALMDKFGVSTPWQAFVQVRLLHYQMMLADPQVIRDNQWSHNVALLEEAQRTQCKIGLATMSYCDQVRRVLDILNLKDAFDFVASRDDVEHGKPAPEIYHLVASELDVPPEDCLVIEDSPSGVKAALAAGMWCIAVTTPFTREALQAGNLLEERWIVNDANMLPAVVQQLVDERMDD
jgi:HAD superfamily hydrolase (TIGR01549 family)